MSAWISSLILGLGLLLAGLLLLGASAWLLRELVKAVRLAWARARQRVAHESRDAQDDIEHLRGMLSTTVSYLRIVSDELDCPSELPELDAFLTHVEDVLEATTQPLEPSGRR